MKTYTLQTKTNTYEFVGVVLGASTSESDRHTHTGDVPAVRSRAGKCSACRWQETTIYRTQGGRFVLHTVGRSRVPGEVDFQRVADTDSARELIELLTVKGGERPFIPAPAARALAQAADIDDRVADAYDNRAVIQ